MQMRSGFFKIREGWIGDGVTKNRYKEEHIVKKKNYYCVVSYSSDGVVPFSDLWNPGGGG